MRLAGRRDDPGLYDPVVTSRPDNRRNFEALVGVTFEIGDVGSDRIALEGILQCRLLVGGQRSPARADRLPEDCVEVERPTDYRCDHLVSLTERRRLTRLHDGHQARVQLLAVTSIAASARSHAAHRAAEPSA